MKRWMIAVVVCAVLTGCAEVNTQWAEWRAPALVNGKGGTVQQVNGMDVWVHGEPDRAFKVLGVIEQNFIDDEDNWAESKKQLIEVARTHGGDGVILFENSAEVVGYKSMQMPSFSDTSFTPMGRGIQADTMNWGGGGLVRSVHARHIVAAAVKYQYAFDGRPLAAERTSSPSTNSP